MGIKISFSETKAEGQKAVLQSKMDELGLTKADIGQMYGHWSKEDKPVFASSIINDLDRRIDARTQAKRANSPVEKHQKQRFEFYIGKAADLDLTQLVKNAKAKVLDLATDMNLNAASYEVVIQSLKEAINLLTDSDDDDVEGTPDSGETKTVADAMDWDTDDETPVTTEDSNTETPATDEANEAF